MVWAKRAGLALTGCGALAGVVFVLDSQGNTYARQSFRAARRLQDASHWMPSGQGLTQGLTQSGQGLTQAGQGLTQGATQYGGNVASQGMDYGRNVMGHAMDHGGNAWNTGNSVADKLSEASPGSKLLDLIPQPLKVLIVPAQILFAILYYCMVVSNYPFWNGPTPMSCQIQSEPAPCSLTNTSPTNCCLSWCCYQARAAHTLDRTGVLDYWCALLAMFFCPFCTLCYANACTDLNPKLGGEPANPIASAACTWCCFCCVIAQDAESLDAATGCRTEPCGVSGGMMPYGGGGYGGPMQMGGGYPPQMMMQPQW